MGAFWSSRIGIITSLGEITGYKSGLALTRPQIREHLEDDDLFSGDDQDHIRMRAEEYEELVRTLLYRVGAIPTPNILFPGIRMYHKYRRIRSC
jgi:restriction system protein